MTTVLAWGDRSHWATQAKPCRYCGDLTHLRDEDRCPSHKVCAEQALTVEPKDGYGRRDPDNPRRQPGRRP